MNAIDEILDQGPNTSQNQGAAPSGPQAPATRDVGDEAEDGSETEVTMGRNIIVAIGINEYHHHPRLDNPINDAQAVLALFKQCGFQELPGVPSLVANDATRLAIADLPRQLEELLPDDSLVIFFAGHGESREKHVPNPRPSGEPISRLIGYLIPVDGPKDKPGEWIKLDAFLDDISDLPARHIFVILDACKSGIALDDKFKSRGGEQPTAVATLRKRPSRKVMTSAQHDEKAAEGGGGSGHSVFAEALIEAIQDRQADKDGDGYVKTLDLFSYVQDRVSDRAKTLFNLKQTPDYGTLPGGGSGDLVISLREGAFNRLIEQALGAMLRHDVTRLDELVADLIKVNPTYPTTLYLQFRLKLMQGDILAAAQLVSRLRDLHLLPGTLPLSEYDLAVLRLQLDFCEPLFRIAAGNPPVAIDLLTGRNEEELQSAPQRLCPAGDAFQIEDAAKARFQVTNLAAAPVFLFFVGVDPIGRLVIGPLLDPTHVDVPGLAPQTTELGRSFTVRGLPGSVTEARIFCSPQLIWELMSPPTFTASAAAAALHPSELSQMQMLTVWYQLSEDGIARPTSVQTILSAFV